MSIPPMRIEDAGRLDEVLGAYLEALDAGRAPERDEWLARHPDLADALRGFLDDLNAVTVRTDPLRRAVLPPGERTEDGPRVRPTQENGAAEAPHSFGDYELLEEIGHGAMGVIYKARQKSANRLVALKMILTGRYASPAEVRRFHNEAEAAANLDHPNIVPIYEVGECDGNPYFSMKLIEGGGLDRNAKRYRADPRAAARLVAEVSRAIHHAHQRGVLHRDLKPSNILLGDEGQPFVTDFGLAKRLDGPGGLTQSGALVGTPEYMAPEQATGQRGLTTAVDVYGLGTVLYAVLAGRPPLVGAHVLETLEQIRNQEPAPPSRWRTPKERRLPRDLETVCLKCLHKDPARRYATALELAGDLQRFLDGEPVLARPVPAWRRGPVARWVRRNKVAASLVLLFAFSAPWLSAALWQWRVAEAARARLGATLYLNHIVLAERHLSDGNPHRATQLLHNEDFCPQALRGWEWHYLNRLCHGDLTLRGHTDDVRAVAFDANPDRKRLATAGRDGAVKVWDTVTGRELRSIAAHPGGARSVAFGPGGEAIATAGDDLAVRVWDAETGAALLTLPRAGSLVAYSPDGTRLATAGKERGACVWDARKGDRVLSLDGHDGEVLSVTFSPDGERIATTGYDRVLKLWDARTGRLVRAHPNPAAIMWCAAFSPDGKLLAGEGGFVTVWDASTGKLLSTLGGENSPVTGLAFGRGGDLLVAAFRNGSVQVWDLPTGKVVFTPRPHANPAPCLAFAPGGSRLAVPRGRVVTLDTYDPSPGQPLRPQRSFPGLARTATFSADGRLLVTGDNDHNVRVWDATPAPPDDP